MTNETPITVDADTVRRIALNADSNPRETIYGEATQTLNPITGRPYAVTNGVKFTPFCEHPAFLKGDAFQIRYGLLNRQTNDEIELQKSLVRMGVRNGDLHEFYCAEFLAEVDRLVQVYAESPHVTLDSITDWNGLGAALEKAQPKVEKSFKSFKIFEGSYVSSRGLYDLREIKERLPEENFDRKKRLRAMGFLEVSEEGH